MPNITNPQKRSSKPQWSVTSHLLGWHDPKESDNNNFEWGCGVWKTGTLGSIGRNVATENSMQVPQKKKKIQLPYDPAILLGTYAI